MSDRDPKASIVDPGLLGPAGRVLSKAEVRQWRPDRETFMRLPRRPITVVLDGVKNKHDIGSIFRVCDAFLAERLVFCGPKIERSKRKIERAAARTQHWVPWETAENCAAVVAATKAAGAWVVVAERTTTSRPPADLAPTFPVCIILGSKKRGVAQDIVDLADAAVSVPADGMANTLNVAAVAAILLQWLSLSGKPTAGAGGGP
jgi:23S rRNA (guanosine2251-2'-O)-methyltransferase